MDSENIGKETIVKVTDWLRGIWEMRRRNGPVQQWVDSIPSPIKTSLSISNGQEGVSSEKVVTSTPTEPKDIPFPIGKKPPAMTVSAPINVPNISTINTTGLPSSLPHKLVRDTSLQSDSSHCSSVESLLELRKADPEAILLGLGFGGCPNSPQEPGSLSRIPKRFLQPSKLKGIAINDFMKQQQETSESFDTVSLGYRGLTGSPYVAPSEIVQKIMQRLREHESHEHDSQAIYNPYEQYSPQQYNGQLSVLSPDNRQYLERPRSKSPDMRNKRMIIGQKSFAFGHDGDLIEINSSEIKESFTNNFNSNSNIVENSEVSEILDDINTVIDNNISEEVITKNIQEINPRQLLFKNSGNLYDSNINLPEQSRTKNLDVQNVHLHKNTGSNENITVNLSTQNLFDIRRASDGYCDTKLEEIVSVSEGRRHSDSFIHAAEEGNRGFTLSQKRRTLRRQPKISDIDNVDYSDLNACIPNIAQYNEIAQCNLHEDIDIYEQHNSIVRTESNPNVNRNTELRNEKGSEHSEEMYNSIQIIDNNTSIKEEQQQSRSECDKNESLEQDNMVEENTVTCCCRSSGTKKYLEKMEKIIQENKNMVAKSRREMAEIREMLTSVLSVRLEPGF